MSAALAVQMQTAKPKAASNSKYTGIFLQAKCACGSSLTGQCPRCNGTNPMNLQWRGVANPSNRSEAPPIVHEVLRSPGQPLDAATRAFMEPRFGHDFSDVRVHTDAKAAESARSVNALAYTVGRDVVFQPEHYKPGSTVGKRLLAHELTHVLQQNQGGLHMQRAELRANTSVEVTHVGYPMLSRLDPPYPGAISRCRAMGVPCPAPHFHHGTVCRLVSCSRASTANLPFAISPGICIYQCSDGQICACVLLGSATSAICVITLCDSAAQASSDTDYEGLATRAVAFAQPQLENESTEQGGDRLESGATMQTKLEIGESGDVYEREADAVAEEVMRIADSAQDAAGFRASVNTNDGLLRRAVLDREFSPLRRGGPLPYREATELSTCIRIMGENNAAYCRQEVLGEEPDLTIPAAPALPPFVPCEPSRALTWADFIGSPSGSTSAFTAYDYPTTNHVGGTRVRAVFNPGRSFVLPQFGNPTAPTLNGCAANITQCESFFPAGSTGGSFALNSTPSVTCPASARASPSIIATSLGDCSGIIAIECQRVAQAESDRLLRHEQLHFDIACVLAGKANAALAAGTVLTTVQSALATKDTQVTNQYDIDTRRGCIAAQQATWTTDVRAGLTSVTIP